MRRKKNEKDNFIVSCVSSRCSHVIRSGQTAEDRIFCVPDLLSLLNQVKDFIQNKW